MKKLTLKQKEFCKNVILTKNQTESVVRSYNVKNRDVANQMGFQLMRKPKIRDEINRLLEQADMSDDYIIGKLKEGMEAKVVANYKGKVYQTDVPDMNTRHKYVDSGLKVKNLYPPQQTETKSLNIDLQLENMSKSELAELLTNCLKNLNGKGGEKVSSAKTTGQLETGDSDE